MFYLLKNNYFNKIIVIFILGMFVHSPSFANGLDKEPYLLRLALALERASNYSSTLARQASIAYPGKASANPASKDFVRGKKDNKNTLTATNLNYISESDNWITAVAVSANITENVNGTLLAAYAYTDTIDQNNTENLNNLLRSDEYFLGYGKMISSDLSLGIQGRLVNADIYQETSLFELGFAPGRIETELSGFDLELGGLYSKDKQMFYGISLGIGRTNTKLGVSNILQLGAIPPGTTLTKKKDHQNILSLSAGLGYLPSETVGIYADAAYLSVASKASGVAEAYKLSLGFDYNSSEKSTFRGGITIDGESELTFSAGLQLYITRSIPLDIACQYNAAPELEQEFGNFNAFNISVAYVF